MTAVLLIVFRALRALPSLAGLAQPPMEPPPTPALIFTLTNIILIRQTKGERGILSLHVQNQALTE